MTLLYFAWVRQKVGKGEEQMTTPAGDVAALIAHLKSLGPNYADAFADLSRIRVAVKPAYLHDQSDPEDDRYVWSYTVTIENKSLESVKLLSRYWSIVDGQGRTQEVRGAGVVGAQPVIVPGETFQYTSGCPLETASGTMSGRYQMMSASGESFEAEIPAFLLESPFERRQIH